MKMYIMVMMMLILTSSLLLANDTQNIIAGNTETVISLKQCEHISINVTGTETIIPGEYTLLNCTEQQTNYWVCNCTNDYELNIQTKLNTYNTYTLNIDYDYTYIQQPTRSNSGGYYSTFTITNNIINATSINDTIKNNTIENNTIKNDSLNNYVTQTLVDDNDIIINDTSINDTSINDTSIKDTIFHQSNLTNTTANNETQEHTPAEKTIIQKVVGWFFSLLNKLRWW